MKKARDRGDIKPHEQNGHYELTRAAYDRLVEANINQSRPSRRR